MDKLFFQHLSLRSAKETVTMIQRFGVCWPGLVCVICFSDPAKQIDNGTPSGAADRAVGAEEKCSKNGGKCLYRYHDIATVALSRDGYSGIWRLFHKQTALGQCWSDCRKKR